MDSAYLAEEIYSKLGGIDNILSVAGCMTRVIVRLKDDGAADVDALTRTRRILSVIKGQGELKIVLGKNAGSVADAIKEAVSPIVKKRRIFTKDMSRAFKKSFKALLIVFFLSAVAVKGGLIAERLLDKSYVPQGQRELLEAYGNTAAGEVLAFAVIMLVDGINRLKRKRAKVEDNEVEILYAPAEGDVMPLGEVENDVFFGGDFCVGAVISPETNVVLSPVDGVVEGISSMQNVYMIKSDKDSEIIVHVGVGTAEAPLGTFVAYTSAGKRVRRGEIMGEFDASAVLNSGFELLTAVGAVKKNEDVSAEILAERVREGGPLMRVSDKKNLSHNIDKKEKM